jgi:hypothetical protein
VREAGGEEAAPAGARSDTSAAGRRDERDHAAAGPELATAKAAAEAKDFKKVKSLLDKRVRGGKGTTEEAQLLLQACAQLKDRACVEAVKKSHPDLSESSADRP